MAIWYNHTPFVREFWNAMFDLANGPMLPANYNPLVNARFEAFRANDVPGGVTRGVDDIISVLTGDAEEWKQRAAKRPDPELPWGTILILILALAMFAVVFAMIVGAMPSAPRGRRRRSASPWSSDPWWTGSSGGFSGGGFSGGGGGFGGGGFGGGGGSFGGGGASGSW
jgi:uncharacterized protein